MSILGSILSVGVPVAKIGAKLLPALLDQLSNDANRELQIKPVITGLVEWVPDNKERKIYAVNRTSQAVVLNYQQQSELDGAFGVESDLMELPPRNAVDATQDVELYTTNGTMSSTYAEVSSPNSDLDANILRQSIKWLPFLTAASFFGFGGRVFFQRRTLELKDRKIDTWELGSDTRLKNVAFNYQAKDGQKIDFKVELKDKNDAAADMKYNYEILMEEEGDSVGLLRNFTVKIEAEEADFKQLLRPCASIPIEQLPLGVRSMLNRV